MSRIVWLSFLLAGVITSLIFNRSLDVYFNKLKDFYFGTSFTQRKEHANLFSAEELSEYNGEIRPELYLALMGNIYDVSEGSKHYGKGSPYNYFVGKDGSRAFVTGNFNDNSVNKDHIIDLTCDELRGLINWSKILGEKYKLVGFLIGRYYDSQSKESEYHLQCKNKVERCSIEKELATEENRKFPPCNIAWSAEDGTRVWCTKSSGGINRSWTGVPRQLYSPGSEKPRCVCVNVTSESQIGMFKEYENCSSTSTSCNIQD